MSLEIRKAGSRTDCIFDYNVCVVLFHTCPVKYGPVETFMPNIDQSKVDRSTENWLGEIESKLIYDKWYCGHYHIAKKIYKLQFMFDDYDTL